MRIVWRAGSGGSARVGPCGPDGLRPGRSPCHAAWAAPSRPGPAEPDGLRPARVPSAARLVTVDPSGPRRLGLSDAHRGAGTGRCRAEAHWPGPAAPGGARVAGRSQPCAGGTAVCQRGGSGPASGGAQGPGWNRDPIRIGPHPRSRRPSRTPHPPRPYPPMPPAHASHLPSSVVRAGAGALWGPGLACVLLPSDHDSDHGGCAARRVTTGDALRAARPCATAPRAARCVRQPRVLAGSGPPCTPRATAPRLPRRRTAACWNRSRVGRFPGRAVLCGQ